MRVRMKEREAAVAGVATGMAKIVLCEKLVRFGYRGRQVKGDAPKLMKERTGRLGERVLPQSCLSYKIAPEGVVRHAGLAPTFRSVHDSALTDTLLCTVPTSGSVEGGWPLGCRPKEGDELAFGRSALSHERVSRSSVTLTRRIVGEEGEERKERGQKERREQVSYIGRGREGGKDKEGRAADPKWRATRRKGKSGLKKKSSWRLDWTYVSAIPSLLSRTRVFLSCSSSQAAVSRAEAKRQERIEERASARRKIFKFFCERSHWSRVCGSPNSTAPFAAKGWLVLSASSFCRPTKTFSLLSLSHPFVRLASSCL